MNWTVLKALKEIFDTGSTAKKRTLMDDADIQFLLSTFELREGVKTLVQGNGFSAFYIKNHLENYQRYTEFLLRNDLLKPQLRIQENDLRVLIDLEERMQTGDLLPIRNQIAEAEETVRGVSQMFFTNDKYLEKHPSLIDAVKFILGIEKLADDKDQQYKYVLDCTDPSRIVLCENLNYLKRPTQPRTHHIELWYAGGKNIEKLNYVDTRGLPIYYSCDWDYDGLLIYQAVKRKIPDIRLLYPTGQGRSIQETEHQSHWFGQHDPSQLSGLDQSIFNRQEFLLIEHLIAKNEWIIEESNDLIKMLEPYL